MAADLGVENVKKKYLAYGVEPQKVKYRLRLARYPALAATVADYVAGSERETQTLLDIGVGYGRTFAYLNSHGVSDRIQWHGIDLRRTPQAELFGADRYQIKLANVAEGLPYGDDTFDIVVAEQILEHLHDPETAVREIYRVARPGALVIIGVPIFPAWFAGLRNFYIRTFPRVFRWFGSDHWQTFSLGSIRRLLLREGCVEERDVRGFRLFSGGIFRFLENYHWWYRLQGRLGRRFPALSAEVQFVLYRLPD